MCRFIFYGWQLATVAVDEIMNGAGRLAGKKMGAIGRVTILYGVPTVPSRYLEYLRN